MIPLFSPVSEVRRCKCKSWQKAKIREYLLGAVKIVLEMSFRISKHRSFKTQMYIEVMLRKIQCLVPEFREKIFFFFEVWSSFGREQ